MSANDEALVPQHYQSKYLHWDLVLRTGMDYLAGSATAYVVRWRKKGGLSDLVKAKHYVVKMYESYYAPRQFPRPTVVGDVAWIDYEVHCFILANDIGGGERRFIEIIASWSTRHDLERAIEILDQLILSVKDGAESKPVRASDSNKHAERA